MSSAQDPAGPGPDAPADPDPRGPTGDGDDTRRDDASGVPVDAEPGQPGISAEFALDTALGAASTANRVAAVVGRSLPGRLATAATRFIATPLAEEGHEVRERAAPAAKELVQQATPGVVEAVDINEVLAAVDLDALLANVDLDALLASVDVDALVGRIDVGAIVERVDIGAIIDRVDIDAIVGRVDVDAIIDRVDIQHILDKLDLNEVIARVDVDSLLKETELGAIIARSTSGVANEALDAVRRQGVSLDNLVARIGNRLMRRDPEHLPKGPPLLVSGAGVDGERP